jgi:hypothetical protein
MDIQRLRNLTTGRLHTEMSHVYEDIEYFTGQEGIMTHMLPNACKALEPYLQSKIDDPRFWDWEYDVEHTGHALILPMNEEEQAKFWAAYHAMPSALEKIGKNTK